MPYEGEFAQYRSIRRIAESDRVKNLLGDYEVRGQTVGHDSIADVIATDVPPSDYLPKFVLAVDGSHAEVEVRNGFPGAEASYVTVASVLLDLARSLELDQRRPVNPVDFRTLEQADSIDCALPGCNIIARGDRSADQSLRRKLFEVFSSVQMIEDGESLLETYEALLAHKPRGAKEQDCPYRDCPCDDKPFRRTSGTSACPCERQNPIFSTDALRIHEGMNPAGTNGALFAEVMQVLERVWIVHLLRTMEAKGWLHILKHMAIVLDGPLAVFGHPAWLSKAISSELCRINSLARSYTDGQDLLMIGVEKSGAFVQHFESIDVGPEGERDIFPRQRAALLNDSYIKTNIIFSDSPKLYGEDTYFGRKFLYKTRSGAKVVAMVPFLDDHGRDTRTASSDQFPRLADVLNLLDKLVSSRYPNALTPLVSAHAEAAIPMNLGKRVLENLARQLIGEQPSGR